MPYRFRLTSFRAFLLVYSLCLCVGISMAQDTPVNRACGLPEGGFQNPSRTAAVTGGLWLRDSDTGETFRAATEGAASHAAWSPDGSTLAYQVREAGADRYSLVLTGRDGTEARKMVVNTLIPRVFAWSWGGQCIAYGIKTESGAELIVADASGENAVSILVLPAGETLAGVIWSPDGTRLGWLQIEDKTGTGTLITADTAGVVERRYVLSETYAPYRDLAWSPLGRFVAFLGTSHSNGRPIGLTAYSLELASGNRIRLTQHGTAGGISWSRTGADVALIEDGQITTVSPDGAARKQTGIPALGPLFWLGDGSQVLAVGSSRMRPGTQLFVMNLRDGIRYPMVDLPVAPEPGMPYAISITGAVTGYTLERLTPETLPVAAFSPPNGLPPIERDHVQDLLPLGVVEGKLSPDMLTRIALTADNMLTLYNSRSGAVIMERNNIAANPFVSYSANGRYAAVTGKSADRRAHLFFLWDTSARTTPINIRRSAIDTDGAASFNQTGSRLVVPSTVVWDIGERQPVFDTRTRLPEAVISPDGNQVAFAIGSVIYLLPADDFTHMSANTRYDNDDAVPVILRGQMPYTVLHYSPDGMFLLAGRFDGKIDVWELAVNDVRNVFEPERANSYVASMAFSSDARLMAVGMQGYSYAVPSYTTIWDFLDQTYMLTLDEGSDVMFATQDRALLIYNGATTHLYSLEPDPNAPPVCTLTANRNGNMRGGPGVDFERVGSVRTGDVVDGDGKFTRPNGRVWYRLTTGAWIREDLVDAVPECDSLPEIEQ